MCFSLISSFKGKITTFLVFHTHQTHGYHIGIHRYTYVSYMKFVFNEQNSATLPANPINIRIFRRFWKFFAHKT
jgi:hypothetical protein